MAMQRRDDRPRHDCTPLSHETDRLLTDPEVRVLIALGRHACSRGRHEYATAAEVAPLIAGMPRLEHERILDALILLAHARLAECATTLLIPSPPDARFRLSTAGMIDVARRCGHDIRGLRVPVESGRVSRIGA